MARRITPLEPPYDDEVDELLAPLRLPDTGRVVEFFRVLARHPHLMRAVLDGAGHAFSGRRCRITAREREIVAFRTMGLDPEPGLRPE